MATTKQLDLFLDYMLVCADELEPSAQEQVSVTQLPDLPYVNQHATLSQQLQEELRLRCKLSIALTITDNTSTMMSVRHSLNGEPVRVRLHRMFLTAPESVRKALAYWVQHPRSRKYGLLFREFIVARSHEIRNTEARVLPLVTRGTHYDLKAIFDDLNHNYFADAIAVAISWGRDSGRNTRSIRFGGFYPNEQLIRIHPRLDQAFVPAYIIRYIVYHEMLHAHIGIEQTENGRRSMHPKAFKQMEMAFPEYEKAIAWIENSSNLRRILRRSRNSGQELKKK